MTRQLGAALNLALLLLLLAVPVGAQSEAADAQQAALSSSSFRQLLARTKDDMNEERYGSAAQSYDQLLAQLAQPHPPALMTAKLCFLAATAHWFSGNDRRAVALLEQSGCLQMEKGRRKAEGLPDDCNVVPIVLNPHVMIVPLEGGVPFARRTDSILSAVARRHELETQTLAAAPKLDAPIKIASPLPMASADRLPASPDGRSERVPAYKRPWPWLLLGGSILALSLGLTFGLHPWEDLGNDGGKKPLTNDTNGTVMVSDVKVGGGVYGHLHR